MLAALDKKARRDLREAEKAGLRIERLSTPEFADQLMRLEGEAKAHSDGSFQGQDWRSILRLSEGHPELSRVAGLFVPGDAPHAQSLVAFAWGCMHGTHGEYRAAGTARIEGNKLSFGSPLLWDLVLWAKRQGATWFDLGGVTLAEAGAEDPLAGISSFKRRFSREVAEVGEDWILEAHPLRSRAAALLGKGASSLNGVAALFRGRG